MLHFDDCITDITFSNKRWDTGEFRMFSITKLTALINRDPGGAVVVVTDALKPELRDMYLNEYGVEAHRLGRLKPPFDPVLAVQNRDNSVTVVDGAHRIAYAYIHNWPAIAYKIIGPTLWEQCIIDPDTFPPFMDIRDPEVQKALLGGWSGIL